MQIHQTGVESREAKALLALLHAEWSDLDKYETERDGMEIPTPIVALEDNRVIGGAAFSNYTQPGGTNTVTWLNAVLVLPEFRGRGIASRLIRAAEEISPLLYALTDIPDLYTKLGWQIHHTAEDGHVVYTDKKATPPDRGVESTT